MKKKKKPKIFLSLEAIKDNSKAMRLYNKTIGKLNAVNGIHPIEHPDGMGGNTRTQWPFGSAQRLPRQLPFDRSHTHTAAITSMQIEMLKNTKTDIDKLQNIDSDIKNEIISKSKLALQVINDPKRKKPLTEYELIKLLKSKGTRMCVLSPISTRLHTTKYKKRLCKRMGRKRANERIKRYVNQYQSEQESI